MKPINIILLIACFSMTSKFVAAEYLTPDLLACANVKSEKQRLQCFDNYIVQNKTLPSDKISSKTHTTTPVESVTPDAQSEEKLITSFGQAHRYTNKEREFDEMESIVKSAKRNLHKKWKIELENGQIWIEKGGDKRAKFSQGDSVVIVRGVMNSFQLKKIGTKRRIRVRRIL